jgi:hypothetical protein
MRLKYGLLCDFASHGQSGKPIIVHVFDFMAMVAPEDGTPILLPLCYLALSFEATPFEHGDTQITIRLIDQDGFEGGSWTMPTSFRAPIPGHAANSGLALPVTGLQVPDFGDYLFEILWGAQRLGEVKFSVIKAIPMATPPVVS